MGICQNYQKPKDVTLKGEGGKYGALGMSIMFGCYFGIPIGLIYGLYRLFNNGVFWGNFFLCMIGVSMIGAVLGGILGNISEKYEIEKYKEQLNQYNQMVKEDNIRVQKELKRKQGVELQISVLEQKKTEVSEILNNLYDMNIIYPKYRNFVAVATFYEYFDSQICNQLEGHEGAYNIFETEIRLNAIISKLDDIFNHLEQIRSNQYVIYNAICEGNKIANGIYQQTVQNAENLEAIADNSAITLYNSMITTKNTEILKFIETYKFIKN